MAVINFLAVSDIAQFVTLNVQGIHFVTCGDEDRFKGSVFSFSLKQFLARHILFIISVMHLFFFFSLNDVQSI